MQRDRGRSSTDRREAAILRAWRVGNSLAAMRASKRHAGRTHKSRHMQNEARCISHNSPNELLPRVAYKVHTCGDIVSYVCAPQHAMLHMVFAQSGVPWRHMPCITWFRLLRQISVSGVCALLSLPTMHRVPSLTLQLCRSLVYLWQPDSNAFQQEASRSAQRLRGTCCWGAQGAARDPPPSHSSRTIRSSTLDAIRFIRVARRSPTGV